MSLIPIEQMKALINDVTLLLRQEIALAKAETGEKLEQAQAGLFTLIGGLLMAMVALFILAQALVLALANIMPPSLAALAVGVCLATFAAFAIHQGRTNLAPSKLMPKHAFRAVQRDLSKLSEKTS